MGISDLGQPGVRAAFLKLRSPTAWDFGGHWSNPGASLLGVLRARLDCHLYGRHSRVAVDRFFDNLLRKLRRRPSLFDKGRRFKDAVPLSREPKIGLGILARHAFTSVLHRTL